MYANDEEKRRYRMQKDEYVHEDTRLSQGRQQRRDELDYELERVREKQVLVRDTMPGADAQGMSTLRIASGAVIGTIFDRVRFLQQRITELENSIALRHQINAQIVAEIDEDIADKDHMVSVLSDSHERRNLKLDISVLRKEKRHELVQFWKDVTELSIELRQRMEEHETEQKIASLFAGTLGGAGTGSAGSGTAGGGSA